MNMNDYQIKSTRTIPSGKTQTELLTNFALGLAGEAGETVDMIKKFVFHGHPLDIEKVAKELGDQMFYIAGMATVLNLKLDDIAAKNINKLMKRYPQGFSESDSINRVE